MVTTRHQNISSSHEQQNIVVNNLNTHPPLSVGINGQNFDVVV
jgi:hypothetical protein